MHLKGKMMFITWTEQTLGILISFRGSPVSRHQMIKFGTLKSVFPVLELEATTMSDSHMLTQFTGCLALIVLINLQFAVKLHIWILRPRHPETIIFEVVSTSDTRV